MRAVLNIVGVSLLAVLAAWPAFADPITVKLTGRVVGWVDMTGTYLNGQVALDQAVTAIYTYDTDTPDIDSSASTGRYQPSGAQGASIRVTTGMLVFESLPTSQFTGYVFAASSSHGGGLSLMSYGNKPLANGTSVDSIEFHLADSPALTSDALPAGAPDVQAFTYRQMRVRGAPWGGMEVMVEIDSAELVPPAIEASPATGSFLSQQRFDAAVLLPIGAQVSSMQASVNGAPIALNYPGTCQVLPPNVAGQAAILCADAHTAVASMTGNTRVDWQVELTDGTVHTTHTKWRLVP